MAQEAVKERLDIGYVFLQCPIVHPTGEQGAARHEEKILYGIQNIAGQIFRKLRSGDIVEPVLSPGISENPHIGLCGKQACGKKLRVAAARYIHRAVGILLADRQQLPYDTIHLVLAGFDKSQFGIPPTMTEKLPYLILTFPALRYLCWT